MRIWTKHRNLVIEGLYYMWKPIKLILDLYHHFTQKVYSKSKFSLSVKYFDFYYKGQGKFFYVWKWNQQNIKPGLLHLSYHKYISIQSSIIFLAMILFFTPSKTVVSSANNISKIEIKDSLNTGVGGGGKVLLKEVINQNELKKMEQDELLKDQLLGVEASTDESENMILGSSSVEKKQTEKFEYRVKANDTLSGIAKRFKINVESIAGSSKIRRPDELTIGQKLYIPSKKGFFYRIKKKDQLGKILQKYKVSYSLFSKENPHVDVDFLKLGDELFLPNAKPKNLIVGWALPVASHYITSGFGWRRYPWRSFHKGLDIKAHYTTVKSAMSGVVTYSGWLGGYGRAVVINHLNGYKTLYAHLSRTYVKKGARVRRGSSIARSGNTGRSTGPHLHFELVRNGRHINPLVKLRGLYYGYRHRRRR